MCFELFFGGFLETWDSLEQLVPGGLIGYRQENVGLHIRHCPDGIQHVSDDVTSSKIVRGNFAASSVATFLDLVPVTLQRSLMAWV